MIERPPMLVEMASLGEFWADLAHTHALSSLPLWPGQRIYFARNLEAALSVRRRRRFALK
jgi:hypothetical protein